MHPEPVALALKEITESRRLLETLITSSESFDYVAAKAVLQELERKVRVLGKVEAKLVGQQVLPEGVIRFPQQSGVDSGLNL